MYRQKNGIKCEKCGFSAPWPAGRPTYCMPRAAKEKEHQQIFPITVLFLIATH